MAAPAVTPTTPDSSMAWSIGSSARNSAQLVGSTVVSLHLKRNVGQLLLSPCFVCEEEMSSEYESADLIIKLYDLRRKEKLRIAREWCRKEFQPASAERCCKR